MTKFRKHTVIPQLIHRNIDGEVMFPFGPPIYRTEIDHGILDKASLMYLAGMTIEYRKEIFGSFLELKNPNAKSTCGCGESFGA